MFLREWNINISFKLFPQFCFHSSLVSLYTSYFTITLMRVYDKKGRNALHQHFI